MKDTLRVGVIGAGWVAVNRHIPSFMKDDRVKIMAVTSINIADSMSVAKHFGIPKSYDNIDELLKQSPDIVDVCTPPFTHHELIVKLAEAGCHILVEKPFAMNSAEAQTMVDVARRNNVKLCVCHNFLFSRSMAKARMLRDSDLLGKVTGAIALQMTNLKRRLPNWYPSLPGGLFFDESPHMLYLILEFLGNISVVWSHMEKWNDNPQPLSNVSALMQSKEAIAHLRFDFNAPRDEWILVIIGTKRVLLLDIFRDIVIELGEGGEHTPFEVLTNSLDFISQFTQEIWKSGVSFTTKRLYYGHEQLIHRFIDSVENDTAPPVSGEQGKRVIELIEQILHGQK